VAHPRDTKHLEDSHQHDEIFVRRIVKFLVEEGFPIDTVEAFKAMTHLEYYHHSLTNNEKSAVSIISDKLLETYSSEDLDMLYLLHHAHPPPRYLSME
jgi:hypothetical protein